MLSIQISTDHVGALRRQKIIFNKAGQGFKEKAKSKMSLEAFVKAI